ncbi:Nuclear factor related to kappa-B-binding protein [Actinidia chinensis var. chinensis]|uniref:Nuclear factor related to kappa-B-binding protein n=1 Tax=Actinidia chinensis var. chinensis TaxID=1590841 RepID=A0A2R6P7P8_ACTCC|nr:Nuclear factor related to kappa-B-binding protein [Actinidia chinensis var. chinensis]
MAIEKNSFKVSRLDLVSSSWNRENMSSEDEFNDCDSGAGSDDYDWLELWEIGEEFCRVGDETCRVPFELYDLAGLGDVLSMDVWNEFLTEEERFNLTKYLPDMDQETFMRTLKELFTGSDFYFGSPVTRLFDMLKGGVCEPRVALYRQGLNSFQKRQHYHLLRKHQNSMVATLYQMRGAWLNCRGYSIEEKLHELNIMKSQKSLMYENREELESNSSERYERGEGLWSRKLKNRKHGLKMGRHSSCRKGPALDFPLLGRPMPLEQAKLGKQNPKGTLKLAGSKTSLAKELVGCFPSVHKGVERKSGPYDSTLADLPRQNKTAGYDLGAAVHMRSDSDAEETMYEVAVQRDQDFSSASALDRTGPFMMVKKHEALRADKYATDSFMGLPGSLNNGLHACVRNMTVNKLSDIKVLTAKPSTVRTSYDYSKKVTYLEKVQQFPVEEHMKFGKSQAQNLLLKGSCNEFSNDKAQGEAFSVYPSFKNGAGNVKSKKLKIEETSDLKVNEWFFRSEYRAKPSQEKVRAISIQNGGRDTAAMRSRSYAKSKQTESDTSEQIDEDEYPFMRTKLAYHHGVLHDSVRKSGPAPKKAKLPKKDNARPLDRVSHSSMKMSDLGEHPRNPEVENYSLKGNQKCKNKMHDSGRLRNLNAELLEYSYFSGPGRLNSDDEQKQKYKVGKSGQLQGEHGERFKSLKAHPTERKQKGDFSVPQSNYLQDHVVDEESLKTLQLVEGEGGIGRSWKKGKVAEAYGSDRYERYDVSLSTAKKRKMKEDVTYDERDDNGYMHSHSHSHSLQQLDTFLRKRGKRNLEDDSVAFEMGSSEPPAAEMGAADVELEPRPQKKSFTLITPTVHSGFSFSIIHLLSAVRMAMITLLPEDSLMVGKHFDKNDGRQKLREEQDSKQEGTYGVHLHENLDINKSGHSMQLNVPSLTVQEIVNRVRSNPGDPCILETQEPLQDLVRGVLKILSSKTAPLGAKGWKPIVLYEKSTKSWSWIDPVPPSSSDHEAIEEVTSPEAWCLPHKMLVKLVDSFANWLKCGQETLQQIGSLPAPPSSLMQFNLDEKERFRDLRAQRSLTTISSSSEEVRAYFRREEVLRYSIPDRTFSYTAIDGKKSIVAPMKRCGGKPTSKARDHFILKHDRPPHVTILCLVRDAAARLPGSMGTRSDVCTLIRDSQYIVEDVSDAQVNQVVSGALDRLHYERDPCVQFDGEKKLWVYLHREREEEDFEDDGTSSTKTWKRPKKEAGEPLEQATVMVAYHGAGEQTGFELSSDLNVEPSCGGEEKESGAYVLQK